MSLPRIPRQAPRRLGVSISTANSPVRRPSALSRKAASGRSSSMSPACVRAMPSPYIRCASASGACAPPSSPSRRSPSEQDRIRDELKWITNELGPARDLDVFEADILQPMGKTRGEDARLAEARCVFTGARAKAYGAAAQLIRSDRFRNALLDGAEWIEAGAWTRDPDLRERREET